MMNLGQAHITSAAAPSAFFDRWADMATWPEWNSDTEWVRLDGPFVTGATGVLKPKGGPKTKFVVGALVPEREFTDVSTLLGARLTFRHLVERTAEGLTRVEVTVTLGGPLARVWNLILGKGISTSLQRDLDQLKAAAEAASGVSRDAGAAPTTALSTISGTTPTTTPATAPTTTPTSA